MKRTHLIILVSAVFALGSVGLMTAQPFAPHKEQAPPSTAFLESDFDRAIQEAYERGFSRGFEQGFKTGQKIQKQGRGIHHPKPNQFKGHEPRGDRPERGGFRGPEPRGERPERGDFRGPEPRGDRPERGDFQGPGSRGERTMKKITPPKPEAPKHAPQPES